MDILIVVGSLIEVEMDIPVMGDIPFEVVVDIQIQGDNPGEEHFDETYILVEVEQILLDIHLINSMSHKHQNHMIYNKMMHLQNDYYNINYMSILKLYLLKSKDVEDVHFVVYFHKRFY